MESNKLLIWLLDIFCLITIVYCMPDRRQDQDVQEVETNADLNQSHENKQEEGDGKANEAQTSADNNCWLKVNADKHFETMDALDEKHHQVRQDFQDAISERNLNNEMLEMMLQTRAGAERAIYKAGGTPSRIPAGINLGGYGMMKLENSILFFHRMKLRNETNFRVNYLNNDVYNMVLSARLSLNDLLLFGQYERAITDKDALFYRPTFGELQSPELRLSMGLTLTLNTNIILNIKFLMLEQNIVYNNFWTLAQIGGNRLLLKSVTYKIEGRLRLVQSRLVVEHVLSELHMKDILLMYYINGTTGCQSSEQLPPSAISEFLERLKADLDSWLKDYFNDYLLFFGLSDVAANKELHCYDKQKQSHLNDFMDHTINEMHKKLYSSKPSCANVKTPAFSIFSVNGVQIRLHSGVVRGMDSFYRQSVATGRSEERIRLVDAVIGFSKLKMEYKYLAKISGKTPPLMGLFVLSADEMIAHLGVTMVKDPEAVELSIGYLRQIRPQVLVIEGAINRMVGNFKHVLENEIITLMTNALQFQIKQLATLSRCEPTLVCHEDEGEVAFNPEDVHHSGKGPDYAVKRNDSIELEVPGDHKHAPKKIHIKYSEDFALSESELPGGPVQDGHVEHHEDHHDAEIVHNENTDDENHEENKSEDGRRKGKKLKKTKPGKSGKK